MNIRTNELEKYARDYKIFIDTCSLLDLNITKFWNNIIPLLQRYNNKVIIPLKVIEELKKHKLNDENKELAKSAEEILKKIWEYNNKNYISIKGEKTDNFADNVFNVVFTKFRIQYKLLLITQDRALAEDILRINDSKSVTNAYKIHVKKLDPKGYLCPIYPRKISAINDDEKFKISSTVTDIPDDRIPVSHIPQKGEEVLFFDETWKSIFLTEELGAGGEAVIYATNTEYVAKIYKEKNLTKRKYEKIKLMLSKNMDYQGICFPLITLHNENKEFVGYLMKRAKGKELHRGALISKHILLKNFPDWRKRDTVELCTTILEKIQFLHDRNIIIGDINHTNILVVSPKEVYFVDTDSYQIEGFPCPVGWLNFTAPEIQYKNIQKKFCEFLRTKGNEYFAVATLLFMIMLPGKLPYSQQGGEDPVENIIGMDFSYPLGEKSNKKTPDGPWRFIWSHLTYDIKKAFYTTFRKGEEHSTEETRLSVAEWLALFRYYLELLDSGKYGEQDPMSEELFPTRYKRQSNNSNIICKLCKTEKLESQCLNGICKSCLSKGEIYHCIKCDKEIFFSNYQKYIKQSKPHDYCCECFKWGNEVKMTLRCSECGKAFDITNGEYEFLLLKHFSPPKRCKICRREKRHIVP